MKLPGACCARSQRGIRHPPRCWSSRHCARRQGPLLFLLRGRPSFELGSGLACPTVGAGGAVLSGCRVRNDIGRCSPLSVPGDEGGMTIPGDLAPADGVQEAHQVLK
eukprot:4996556-Pyramimonas_sp.AAC.1